MAAQRVYALFQDVADAERAIGALLDHGVARDHIGIASRRPAEADEADRVRTGFTRITDGQDDRMGNPVAAYEAQPGTLPPAALASTAAPTSSVDTPLNVDEVGKGGITTTTAADAGAGAAVGAGVGLVAGLGLAAAALFIPGIGPVLAAGALASAFGVAAGTTVAGAAVGGAVGYLRDMGMSEQAATHYADRLTEGDYLLTAVIDSADYDEIKRLLLKYNAAGVDINLAAPAMQVMETRGPDPALAAEISRTATPPMTAADAMREGILAPAPEPLLGSAAVSAPEPLLGSAAVPAPEPLLGSAAVPAPGQRIVTQTLDGTPIIPAREVNADTTLP